jgi:hypothetical protein
MKEKKKFIKELDEFFQKKIKKDDKIFYMCDSLQLVKLILQLEPFLGDTKKISFTTKRDLYYVIFK